MLRVCKFMIYVFQGFILDYNSGNKKKRRVTIACCQRAKSPCCTGTEREYWDDVNREPESFVAISGSDFHPYYKEYDQVTGATSQT